MKIHIVEQKHTIQRLKCSEKMRNLMLTITFIPWDVTPYTIGIVAGSAEAFNTKLCVYAPQLAGTHTSRYNRQETFF